MHHATCFTHVPWCMSGSLTRGGGKTFPAFPAHAQSANLRICKRTMGHMFTPSPLCVAALMFSDENDHCCVIWIIHSKFNNTSEFDVCLEHITVISWFVYVSFICMVAKMFNGVSYIRFGVVSYFSVTSIEYLMNGSGISVQLLILILFRPQSPNFHLCFLRIIQQLKG